MKKINIKFKHCYGIRNLEYEFDLSNRTFAIYAANGIMKTSFAKTFDDYAKGQQSLDLAFPDRTNLREILSDGNDLGKDKWAGRYIIKKTPS